MIGSAQKRWLSPQTHVHPQMAAFGRGWIPGASSWGEHKVCLAFARD